MFKVEPKIIFETSKYLKSYGVLATNKLQSSCLAKKQKISGCIL